MPNRPVLSIIVPCYNEQELIIGTFEKLQSYIIGLIDRDIIDHTSSLIFVDDGSTDETWGLILDVALRHQGVKSIKLSKNFGHQYALLAGLTYAQKSADCAVTIDADLQHDLTVIEDMISKYNQGVEIVYAVRKERVGESRYKKILSNLYYKILKVIRVNVVPGHADFRLHGKKSLRALLDYNEHDLFLRGIFPLMGFNHAVIDFDQSERTDGYSKYTWRKMLSLALTGVISFSTIPLRIIFIGGIIVLIISILMSLKVLFSWFQGDVVQGWTELMLSIYFLGAIQLISVGFIGEYVSKIYKESMKRPRYIVDDLIE